MNIDKLEIWVHDHILKNDTIRHAAYGAYQRALCLLSPKMEYDGPIEKITPDDGYEYLFGYYDKCPWSDDGEYLLALKVKNASSKADSTEPADIVRIELATKRIEILATTHSWNVQQGCMAQWLSNDEILYNDFRDGKYCAVVLNLSTNVERIIDMPVYAMSPDRTTALSLDFSRLHRLRPGYGYGNIPETTKNEKCPDTTCIWKIDIATGSIAPLLKYTDFASFEPKENMAGAEHKVNHLMISPNGKRFMVLHRWFQNGVKYTRLVTCNMDGTDMFNLSDDDFVSHCCWKNDEEILSYLNKHEGGKGYYLMKDRTHEYERCWKLLAMDGHPTYSYDGKYVVTDTYPNRRRIQSLYVMNGNRVVRIAQVFSPFKYGLDTRCDLHPRWSRDGKQICFDASFGGKRSVCVVSTEMAVKNNKTEQSIVGTGNPIVSVVIPCFNCAKYINETLESLAAQEEQNFEVVCVNDGSTDGTEEVIKKWMENSRIHIKLFSQENSGVSKARNYGIKESSGKYIIFLDSDDILHEAFISGLVRAKETNHVDTAYCSLSRNIEDLSNQVDVERDFIVQTQEEAMKVLLYKMGITSFANYLYEKSVLEQYDLWFDTQTKYGEDREFNWKYLVHCKSAAYCEKPLYYYRVNTASATKKKASWDKTDLLSAVKRIEEYIRNYQCSFSKEFDSYMYARAMWAVAKTFSVSDDKELYTRLRKEFDVKKCMKRTSRDDNKIVAIASVLYCIHPGLFYSIVRLKK